MSSARKSISVDSFYGIVDLLENESIKRGSASDAMNWQFLGDHIELRRGVTLLGTNIEGNGRISGLFTGHRYDDGQVLMASYGRKVKYYDETTDDFVEVSTDLLPEAAALDDISFDEYHGIGGAFVYLSSKNSSIYKIPVANPDSAVDLSSTSHRGKIKIKMNRMRLWDRKDASGGFDTTGHYLSYIDKDELSDFTDVVAESLGSSGSTLYAGTLAFKSGFPKRTAMYVSISGTVAAGTETFRDTRNGTLLSNYGSTGTINYATGAYSVTFSNVTTSGVTADYYWEDSSTTGIADFSKSTPRTAGQGAVFRQDDGGSDHQNVGSIGTHDYCFHTYKTYDMFISSDDTDATNLPFRTKMGIPYWRAMYESSDGIYHIDAIDTSNPEVRLLRPSDLSGDNPKPKSISNNIKLEGYRFDQAEISERGNYIIVFCRTAASTVNDTMLAYHKIWKSWERHDIRASCSTEYNGVIIAGDSASNNVFEIFSGLTDEDIEIPNYVTFNRDHLDMPNMTKYSNIFEVRGNIGIDQEIDCYLAYDGGQFVKVGTIQGDGPYVDQSQKVTIGSYKLGQFQVGGGGSGIEASPYRVEFRINTPRMETITVQFRATKVGYASISHYGFKDIRAKGRSLPPQYLSNI